MEALVAARGAGTLDSLEKLLQDPNIGAAAVAGIATLKPRDSARILLKHYGSMYPPAKAAAVVALASRPENAQRLLTAVAAGVVPTRYVSPFQLRQMQLFGDKAISRRITELWPSQRLIAEDKLLRIEELRRRLSPAELAQADLQQGRIQFEQTCSKCHKLFGRGETVGPDLTGAQRTNLNYLLENIVDPSASLAVNVRMSIVELSDGRMLSGVIGDRTKRTISLQTPTEQRVLDRDSVEQIKQTPLSLMPDGLLLNLRDEQIRDLLGYIMQ